MVGKFKKFYSAAAAAVLAGSLGIAFVPATAEPGINDGLGSAIARQGNAALREIRQDARRLQFQALPLAPPPALSPQSAREPGCAPVAASSVG